MTSKIFCFILTILSAYSFAEEPSKPTGISQDGELIEENFIHERKIATIQILNKITAKVQNIDIAVNSILTYGPLKIEVKYCWQSSPYEPTENKILMNISDKKPGLKDYQQIFSGWMFSSSPGISSMEHAVYDVVAINCKDPHID